MTPGEMAARLAAGLDGPHRDEDTAAVAGLAAEAVRFLNYATAVHTAGLTRPATACAVTGSLAQAASRLGQCLGQVTDFVDLELAAGRLGDDSGCYPALTVERARRHLGNAARAAHTLGVALRAAQGDLSGLHQRPGGSQ